MPYIYKSQVGKMVIGVDRNVNRFALIINDTCYGHYNSAIAAADDVYMHVTGCYEWDLLDGEVDPPTHISEWERY